MLELIGELRLAARALLRNRVLTLVAVASLALGIGASTTIFTLVDAVAFKPLPFPHAERLVDVHEWSATELCAGCAVGTSYEGFLDFRERARSYDAVEAYFETPGTISGNGADAERIGLGLITSGLLDLVGIRPQLGRAILPSDDVPGAPPVVVLGDGVWRRRYGADPSIVGRTIKLNGAERTVVGVLPAGFRFPELADAWIPFLRDADRGTRADRNYGILARLRPGVTIARAGAEARTIAGDVAREHPDTQRGWSAGVTSYREELAGDEARLFAVLLGAVTFVLLIVCANLAGLLLARGAERGKEIAIRLALGASRARIVRHLLGESVLLAVVGGSLGALTALWGVDLAVASLRTQIPYWIDFSLDGRALAYCAALSLTTGVLVGLAPAMRASRPDLNATLKDGGQHGATTVATSRMRRTLVVGELSLALVLLAGAGLMTKTFLRISARDTGLDTRGVLTGQVQVAGERYRDGAQVADVVARVERRLAASPGIAAVAFRHTGFIAGFGGHDEQIQVVGMPSVPAGASPRFYYAVTPGYFAALALRVIQGRAITAADRRGAPLVAMVNEGAAARLWPNESALGKRIKLGPGDTLPWLTVVGVVNDGAAPRDGEPARSMAYVPFAQQPSAEGLTIFARGRAGAAALAPAIRAAVREADPDAPVADLQTLDQEHDRRFWPYRLYAIVVGSLAALALALATIGVYGLVAYSVAQRTREIGVRMALGAERRDIVALVVRQGGRLAVAGAVVGLVASAGALRVMRSMLFGASPFDPIVLLGVAALLMGVTLLASYAPARRAASVDPLVALRSE